LQIVQNDEKEFGDMYLVFRLSFE